MELIDTIAKLIGILLFYGFMIIAGLMFGTVLLTIGVGALAVYALHNLRSVFIAPPEDAHGNILDYHIIEAQVNLSGISYFSHIWYLVDVNNQFAGIHHIILADGRDVINDVDPVELGRLVDIAEHAWEVSLGEP